MKLTRLAVALATVALLVSGCSLTTHHAAAPAAHTTRTEAAAPAHAEPTQRGRLIRRVWTCRTPRLRCQTCSEPAVRSGQKAFPRKRRSGAAPPE